MAYDPKWDFDLDEELNYIHPIPKGDKGNGKRIQQDIFKDIVKMSNEMYLARTRELVNAISESDFEKVRRILQEGGVDANVKYKYNRVVYTRPLNEYLFNTRNRGGADIDIVRLFIENGADVNAYGRRSYPLFLTNDTRILRLLLDNGADPYVEDIDGDGLLSLKSYSGNESVVRFLVEYGVDQNVQDTFGNTALMKYAQSNNVEIIRFLLEHGANPELENNRGETAYDLARNDEVKRLLEPRSLRFGSRVNVRKSKKSKKNVKKSIKKKSVKKNKKSVKKGIKKSIRMKRK